MIRILLNGKRRRENDLSPGRSADREKGGDGKISV